MGKVVGLAFLSALNPTLLAATTVMLLLPRPQRSMLRYWVGSMLTGVALGLVIVFALEGSARSGRAGSDRRHLKLLRDPDNLG